MKGNSKYLKVALLFFKCDQIQVWSSHPVLSPSPPTQSSLAFVGAEQSR